MNQGIYIGVMSGTSLDGVDLVAVSFEPLKLHATLTIPFPEQLRNDLIALTLPADNEIERMGVADVALARLIGESINQLIAENHLDKSQIHTVGSHGQTIRHRPESGFSLQIGDPNLIAEITGLPVVADFRRRDMAVGGQGAPLVPAFHQALFATTDSTRVLLNLGGIANITVLPAADANEQNNQQADKQVVGYDTGPANLLLDAWTALHTDKDYDAGGAWAESGQIVEPLLNQLLEHPFFARSYPKSTGREDFNLAWLQDELQKFDQASVYVRYSSADVQATLTELTAVSASTQIKPFLSDDTQESNAVYVCGGGALNSYLVKRLQAHLPHCTVQTTASLGLDPTWVEAVAFAWLARQTLMGETGNLPAVTGANKGVVLGQVCFA